MEVGGACGGGGKPRDGYSPERHVRRQSSEVQRAASAELLAAVLSDKGPVLPGTGVIWLMEMIVPGLHETDRIIEADLPSRCLRSAFLGFAYCLYRSEQLDHPRPRCRARTMKIE